MSTFSNKYFIGRVVENEIAIIIGSPEISRRPPTLKEQLRSLLHDFKPARGWIYVRLLHASALQVAFDPMQQTALYSSVHEANNALMDMQLAVEWELREYHQTIDNYAIFDELKVFNTGDILFDLIKSPQLSIV